MGLTTVFSKNFNTINNKIITQLPIAISMLSGNDFIIELANEKNLALWQKTPDEVLNKPFFETFPSLKSTPVEIILQDVLLLGTEQTQQEIPITINSETSWFNITAQPVQNDAEQMTGVIMVSVDVTEEILARKKSENTEKETKIFSRTILESSPDCLKIIDDEGRIVFMNKNGQCLLELDNFGEVENKLWWDLWGDENKEIVQNAVQKSLLGETVQFITAGSTLRGTFKWWDVMVSPVRNSDNGIHEIIAVSRDITSQKQSEEALKYRKALLEAQNDAIPDAILIVDKDGNMASLNKDFAKIWGIPENIIADRDDHAALAYAMTQVIDPEGFIERVRYCYAHPETKAHDEILLKDGRILDRYGNTVVGEDGTNYGWAWYFRDITEQKKNELVVRESEEKYRGIFEKMDQGFCIVEVIFDSDNEPIDYRFLESNPEFKNQTGLENVIGKTISEIVPDIEISWSQKYGHVVMTGESIRFIDYSEAMNAWFEVYAFRLGDRTHNKVAILFTNITERKKAEIEMKASEAKFRSLTETIPQMVWMTDEMGTPEHLSSQWKEYAGEMPISDYWTVISHPDDIESSLNAWRKSVSTGEKFTSETRLKNKEGEYRWHVSVGVPLKDDNGNIIKWIGSITDIHDQKLKEQKKDEFISIASHEMKTPLTSTKAYLQLLEMSLDENDPNFIYAKKASESTERLNKLISELLDSSKIQHGKLNFTNSAFDFDTMIENTIENVQYSSVTHKIIKIGSIKKQFLGDKDRLQQVVINLLTNAIKYSPQANEVIIKLESQNNYLKVSVTDKGVGMSEKHLEKVFDRYYRVEEHSLQFQGLGIGLYISYDIVQRHSGKMWVESVSGEGSTFHFTLPFIN